jgi:hypothetical protein
MYTQATQQALQGLRDLSTLQWYVIPLLALVFYVYASEIKNAREKSDWNPVIAGLTLFGMDFFNETWNGWVMVLTERSAFWTAPGPTALRTMVGWNIEIMFMFAIAGIIYYHSLSGEEGRKILGIPEKWALAVGYSAFCVFVEVLLNIGGHLIWEYSFWNRSFAGVWLIFLIGYFHFFVAIIIVTGLKTNRAKVIALASIYSVAVIMNIIGLGIMGWRY